MPYKTTGNTYRSKHNRIMQGLTEIQEDLTQHAAFTDPEVLRKAIIRAVAKLNDLKGGR